MKVFKFFEYIFRTSLISRWSLMRSMRQEDLKQHSYDVSVVVHALVLIKNNLFGGQLDAGKAVLYALYHDTAEVFTGDIPTPIKHFGGGVLKQFADMLEAKAIDKLVTSLPEALQPAYRDCLNIPGEYKSIIKAADRISALRKCREEIAAGNNEFKPASVRLEDELSSCGLLEVSYFMTHLMTENPMSLDELIEGNGAWLLEEGEH